MKNEKLYIPNILIAFSLCLVFLCCASKKNFEENTNQIESTPKIVFLNYSIEKKSDGSRSVQYVDKIVTEGKLKSYYNNASESLNSGDLECFQLDKNSNTLHRSIIKNPLAKTIEYPNDSLSFETKSLDLNHANFTIRMPLDANTKYIRIFEMNEKKSTIKPLITTKLN